MPESKEREIKTELGLRSEEVGAPYDHVWRHRLMMGLFIRDDLQGFHPFTRVFVYFLPGRSKLKCDRASRRRKG